ncbi:MAG: Co2+/Mg2+ efflux protein ApaG [Candidatus Accumulibacter sp.]|uniref:Co2+/Mg2+ efflux protein ApaG n=1 Tax=Accumulibacter sp. TaxID=2053492 RepID=UPI001A0B3E9F|nr:Co2+/Mg2+ efflux protein ApaG [Accumulibacter sp.]MBE2259954.1 Co2+/Mg2+ efflux protein ApaG [Paracoccaceae bacterium]MCB1940496.1 Co2+/Mg2+ efflux protein ApaG [Accumulibacter sp.]MCP5248287.1 Co2+/Mg2+ efflux protein ApaG [Accumulibacter sp.]
MAESKKYEIAVRAVPQYVAEQSDPDNDSYVFAYAMTIENVGTVAAQLISRHWIISDANGEIQEVRGLGVVGRQPLLQPGEIFEYTSGCQLRTAVGTMRGSYQMTAVDGKQFDATIGEFTLAVPRVLH